MLGPPVIWLPPSPQLPLRPPLSRDCRDLLQRLLERDPNRRISFQDFFAHPWVDLEHMPSRESLARAVNGPAGGQRRRAGLGGAFINPIWWCSRDLLFSFRGEPGGGPDP